MLPTTGNLLQIYTTVHRSLGCYTTMIHVTDHIHYNDENLAALEA